MSRSGIRNDFRWRYFLPVLVTVLATLFILLIPPFRRFFLSGGYRWAYILWIAFGIAFCLTPIVRGIAFAVNALDMPSERKVHRKATPLFGGAAIYIAFLVAILINHIFSAQLKAILIGATLLFVIGVIDDVHELPAAIKLLVQLIGVGIAMAAGIFLRVFPSDFGWVSIALNGSLTVTWIIGITNAFNFFDGMDGMAAGLGVIIAFFLGVIAFQTHQPFLGWVSVAMLGGCLGFLPYNLLKGGRATIFLGDAGSTVIGFILACVAVYGDWNEGNHAAAIVSPLLIFWVLIFDMVHITVDRIMSGKVTSFSEWIDYVGKDHLHHRLADALGGQKRSVLFIYLLSISLGISAVVLRNARTLDAILLMVQAIILVLMVTFLERRGRTVTNRNPKDPLGKD